MNRLCFLTVAGALFLSVGCSCGGDTDGSDTQGGAGTGGSGTDSGSTDGHEQGETFIPTGGTGGAGGSETDPCAGFYCPNDQHCESTNGSPTCMPNDCETLDCSPTEVCVETATGAYCADNSCTDDIDCLPEQYCNGSICVPDICTPGDRHCQGANVIECAPNGGSEYVRHTCGGGSPYFTSECDDTLGACTCEDDWDCPEYTTCEAGICVGTGIKPTCSLPPEPFENVLPVNEITWGGTQANPVAKESPFPKSVQVVHVPIVANLDDDNGDGLIDERDFPEIIFTSFCNSDFTSNGTLRAIHGGGPNKGKDYFASCGSKTWNEGAPIDSVPCTCAEADIDSTASLAVGDLDNDGIPEIVAVLEGNGSNAPVRIYDNRGHIITESPTFANGGPNPAPTLANLDNHGFAEIVVGRTVWTLQHDANGKLAFANKFVGNLNAGINAQGPVSCVANIVGGQGLEVVAGSTAYRMPKGPAGLTLQSECTGSETDPDEVAWCKGQLVTVWDGQTVNGAAALPNDRKDGFCAIADVMGADFVLATGPANPLDGIPEVITINAGFLNVFDGPTGKLRLSLDLKAGGGGGPPNVDDFDGDGFPEVGTALGAAYVVIDFQATAPECPAWPTVNDNNSNLPRTPPTSSCTTDADCGDISRFACNSFTNQCVCLHNGWRRKTEDDSSRVTGSSVFDFNGDGAAEVIYNDECRFRIYDGLTGHVYFSEPSESRTRIEYPIVADVDNDGNAEIVFSTSTESGFCSEGSNPAIKAQYNAGIEVWGDANDTWVSARRIWNQHAYHVTNVTESGVVPVFEPENWKQYNGRTYNTYRSNPRSFGVAPDLTVQAIQVSSPDAVCGELSDQIDIAVKIANIGDLRVGPGTVVGFYGEWANGPVMEALNDASGNPLRYIIQTSLEPGTSIIFSVNYQASYHASNVLPDVIKVVVDDTHESRECIETNNEMLANVEAGQPLPDLTIQLGAINPATCMSPQVPTTVRNIGSAPVGDYVVRYY
ncbi:MAG TPA: VCBS repeat-containing protein, partial [Polyangiaceae bacterium]|nr:VCBS repeat-containing protein [Polyangiaceae bacterium]